VDAGGIEDANVSTGGGTDAISVAGTDGDDSIDVFGANGKATVLGIPAIVTVEGVDASDHLTIDTAAGQDRINALNLAATSASLVVEAGAGADELFGGQGADVLFGGPGDDFVDGNQGADVALMGSEDDRFSWGPGDGSDVIEGQAGADAMTVFGSNIGETIGLKANGSRLQFTRDIASVTLDAAAVESVDYRALGGADSIFVGDLTGTGVGSARIDLAGPNGGGDGAGDVVVTDGTDAADVVDVSTSGASVHVAGLPTQTAITGSEAAIDRLRVQTLGGDDDVTVDAGVSGLIVPEVDLGAGD
jgi:RTX calcium-binding nonapeptide repeat (4 copies)